MTRPVLKLRRPSAARAVVGLDIEPGAIRAVQAHAEGGRLVVATVATAELEPGIYRDGEVVDAEALAGALRALFDEHDLDKRVRIGVANQRIVVRQLLLPPIADEKELATAVRFMAAEELPIPIDQAVLDHHVLGTAETPGGPRTRVLVVAARRAMIDTLLSAVRAAGLRPEGVDLSAFALLRAAGPADGTVLHLAFGGTVNLAVSRGGECLFSRVIGGGTENMAIEIAERAGTTIAEAREALSAVRLEEPRVEVEPRGEIEPPRAEAEPVVEVEPRGIAAADEDLPTDPPAYVPPNPMDLVAPGSVREAEGPAAPVAPPATPEPAPAQGTALERTARTVLADSVRRIAGEVRNSLDFLQSADPALTGGQDASVERLLLTGSAAAIGGLPARLGEQLGLPVEIPALDGAGDASFAVAAGLCVEEVPA